MAEFAAVFNVEHFTGEIQRLPIKKDIKLELINCLQSIIGLNLDDVSSTTGTNTSLSEFNDIIILLNKFAKAAVDALEACEFLPSPLGIICNVVTEFVAFMFNKDIASVVINRFTAILEADLIATCRATCTKITQCISYMQGLPPVDRLQPHLRIHHLQLLASDVPIQTGLDEVLRLGEKVKQMVDTADVEKANKLFEHAQLYCCLATYRELFLLYRFAIQYAFSEEAGPVRNVLSAQKANDREVLKFLYMPTTHSVTLFRRCFLNHWFILHHFLYRRGLVTDDLTELSGMIYKVKSVRFNTKIIHVIRPCTSLLNAFLELGSDSNDAAAHIEFRAVTNNRNVFTLWSHNYRPPRQIYCDKINGMSIGRGEPLDTKSLFYILKVHPQRPRETMCYMIWLAMDHQSCLSTNWNGVLGLKRCSKPDHSYFWILERIQEIAL